MNLQTIERQVLSLIGYDRYSSLSIDTNPEKIEDFANLHTCVNLAREEIKLYSDMPALIKIGTGIVVTAGVAGYSLPSDFDIPKIVYYLGIGGTTAKKLKKYTLEDIPDTLPVTIGTATPDAGAPYSYLIMDTSADLIQIYIYPTPDTNGIILPMYKPILTVLTVATNEDVIMRKYPIVVMNFAAAFAFQIIKKDQANYDKYYAYGMAGCRKINLREASADPNMDIAVENLLVTKRQGRTTI